MGSVGHVSLRGEPLVSNASLCDEVIMKLRRKIHKNEQPTLNKHRKSITTITQSLTAILNLKSESSSSSHKHRILSLNTNLQNANLPSEAITCCYRQSQCQNGKIFTSWDNQVSLLLTSVAELRLHLGNRPTTGQFLLVRLFPMIFFALSLLMWLHKNSINYLQEEEI